MILQNNQEQILYDYVDGKIHYQPLMNIFLNDSSNNWYGLLGKYLIKKLRDSGKEIPKYLEPRRNILKMIAERDKEYSSAGMMFVTALLNKDALYKMFGAALYHDEFGEGFQDTKIERINAKRNFASYFMEIDDVKFHIGFDHRGTSIEMDSSDPVNILKALEKLIDTYVQIID